MRQDSRVVMVEMPDDARVQLLLEEYGFFARQRERFCGHLDTLVELRGKERVAHWKSLANAGRWAEVFGELMREHYDPLYLKSIDRNYRGAAAARVMTLPDGGEAALNAAAAKLLA
jgi:tRNA 2-selenouridine synthase